MSVKREVYCNRCGLTGVTTEDRWSGQVISGWASLDFEIEGPDPEAGKHREPLVDLVYDLCPTCAERVKVALLIVMDIYGDGPQDDS